MDSRGKAALSPWAAIAFAALAGCSTRPGLPELAVASISPDQMELGQGVTVTVRGSGFHVAIASDLDDGTSDAEGISVSLNTIVLDDVLLVGEAELTGTVPGDLPSGLYDVTVQTTDGRSATLPAGFEVLQRCGDTGDCDDGDPCTTSETCVDGSCQPGPRDKDADDDGFVDDQCGGDDCDDDDEDEQPGRLWFPDADGDGLGDASSTGNACERANATDVLNADDCDDSGALPVGTACDDGDDCTVLDACVAGVCTGVNTCNGQCRNDCSGGCDPQGCCKETCGGSCSNSDCEAGCACDLTCNADDCSTTCGAAATCLLRAGDAINAALACTGDAACAVECSPTQSTCELDCQAGASCLLTCGGAGGCDLTCAGDAVVDCGGGVFTCRRACP